MNWKERRRQMKIAKFKRREAMIHGEFKPSKVMEKYDVYFGDCEAPLYKSYNNKKSIEELAEEKMKETFTTYTPPTEDYTLYKMYYKEEPALIKEDNKETEAIAVVARFVWGKIRGIHHCLFQEDYETLFYYVDDSFEL